MLSNLYPKTMTDPYFSKNNETFYSTKKAFKISRDILPYAYISSIPHGLNLCTSWESTKGKVKGISSGFIFYHEKYSIISAHFNINDSRINYDIFLSRIKIMFNTLHYLNNRSIKSSETYSILKHIETQSNYDFNLKELYFEVKKFRFDYQFIKTKERDYKIIPGEIPPFKQNIDFLNALNTAQKTVNYNFNIENLFYLIEERITNNDYSYIHDIIIHGHKNNNLIIYAIIRKFNLLCTDKHRKGDILKPFKSEPLYNNAINRITLKAISLKPSLQNAFIIKQIKYHEKELKKFNQLVANRFIAHQLLFILSEVTGLNHNLNITLDIQIRDQLKAEFVNSINMTKLNIVDGAKQFDKIYKIKPKTSPPKLNELLDVFLQ